MIEAQQQENIGRTEVVLLITPRVLRSLARPDARSIEFAAGTEASTGARPGPIAPLSIPQVMSPPQPATEEEGKPAATPTPGAAPVQPMVPFGGVRPPGQ